MLRPVTVVCLVLGVSGTTPGLMMYGYWCHIVEILERLRMK